MKNVRNFSIKGSRLKCSGWVQDQNQSNVDNPNNARCEASRYFRNKERGYWKLKLMNFKQRVITRISDLNRGFSDFKKGYQP